MSGRVPGLPARPDRSPRRGRPVSEVYAKKFGGPERAAEIIARVTAVAADDRARFPARPGCARQHPRLAHRLLWSTKAPGARHALKERLLAAYFHDGRNIGDVDTLCELAGEVGLRRRGDPAVPRLRCRHRRGARGARARRLVRHHRGPDLCDRPQVVGARCPGSRDVPAGAATVPAIGLEQRSSRAAPIAVTGVTAHRSGGPRRASSAPRVHPDRSVVGPRGRGARRHVSRWSWSTFPVTAAPRRRGGSGRRRTGPRRIRRRRQCGSATPSAGGRHSRWP